MVRLNTIGQDVVFAALLLLTCWGVGQPAYAANPPSLNNPIADVTVTLGAAPGTFRLDQLFMDGVGTTTYSVADNTAPGVVDAVASGSDGRDLTLTYLAPGTAKITVRVVDSDVPTANLLD